MANSNNDLDDSVSELMYQCISTVDAANYGRKEPAILKCHFCSSIKKKFYCVECVRTGTFTHSNTRNGLERFADKKGKKYKIEEGKSELLKEYEKVLSRRKEAEDIRLSIERSKEKIKLLQENIAYCKNEIVNDKKSIEELKEKKSKTSKTLSFFPEKLPRFYDYEKNLKTVLEHKKTKLLSEQSALEAITRKRIKELVTYIFPISKAPSNLSRCQTSSEGQRKADLQEAQTFTYIEGRWSYGAPTDETYSIVDPCLVMTGDFSAYTSWCEKDGLAACRDTADEKLFDAAFGCSAALQYTAQLVYNITNLFDFHVPKRTSFNDFCKYESFEQFYHHVAKLNANILDLCLARQVDYSKLRPEGTISNLVLIIDPEANERTIVSVEEREKFLQPVEDTIEKDMLPHTDSDDSLDDIEAGFVHVSEDELPEAPPMHASFIATSLHSVTSLWKAATGHK